MAQVRTSSPLTEEARFRCRVTLCEIVVEEVALGQYLGFPLSVSFHQRSTLIFFY